MISRLSSKRPRLSEKGELKPSWTLGKVPRPTPNSTRPPLIRSRTAISSATLTGLARGSKITAVPSRIRSVRAAILLKIVIGEDNTRPGLKWYSANQRESTPRFSASLTSTKDSSKASFSVPPSCIGNSRNNPNSMAGLSVWGAVS